MTERVGVSAPYGAPDPNAARTLSYNQQYDYISIIFSSVIKTQYKIHVNELEGTLQTAEFRRTQNTS